jgi:hypothetical protein
VLFDVKGSLIPERTKQLFPFGAVSYLSDSMTAPLFAPNAQGKYFTDNRT